MNGISYRILADENVERATITYLRKLEHDIEWIGDGSKLGLGTTDREIVAYTCDTDRLILTQDDDFFTEIDINETAGVLFQKDQTLSARKTGDIIHEIAQYIDQLDIDLEYVNENWLK